MSLEGTVVKSTGSWYKIEANSGECVEARLKGKIRLEGLKSTNPLAVGDRVEYDLEDGEYLIRSILPRKNYIIRRSVNLSKQTQIIAANVDQLFLVISLREPKTFKGFVDRFLVGAEAYRIPVVIVYNKIDLIRSEEERNELLEWKSIYQLAGYEQMDCSALNEKGMEALKEKMKDKVSIFSGHSGVGKSTLINRLDERFNLRVNSVSEVHRSGKHTTTFAEMFELDFGAKIIDTPGIKGFGNVNLEKQHLSHYFPEMRLRINDCKYHNCVHIDEPECAIKDAVKSGEISESRYSNYLSIYDEDEAEAYRQKGY